MDAYTGVGSRKAPPEVLAKMVWCGQRLAELGLELRTGGADGPDTAFENGCDSRGGQKKVFLPWQGFNGRTSDWGQPTPEAYVIAERVHPAWDRCSRGVRALHARNAHQVLGPTLNVPSLFVVCWTPGGESVGGTRTAIELAADHGIPVFNVCDPLAYRDLGAFLREHGIVE